MMEIKDINIKDIEFRENIRLKRDDTSAELMDSIKQTGLLQPIGISEKKEKGKYNIIWGNRRLSACKNLGWKTIPSIIFSNDEDLTEEEFLIINSVENLQKKPNTLFELGRIVNILRKTMSVSEIASKLSLPRARVETAMFEFKRLPKKWHRRIKLFGSSEEKKGDIPMHTASLIGRIRGLNNAQRDSLMEIASKNDLSMHEIIMLSSLVKTGMTTKQALQEINKYKVINVKFGVDKKMYDVLVEQLESKNFIDFIINALNKESPKLAFKITSQDKPNEKA